QDDGAEQLAGPQGVADELDLRSAQSPPVRNRQVIDGPTGEEVERRHAGGEREPVAHDGKELLDRLATKSSEPGVRVGYAASHDEPDEQEVQEPEGIAQQRTVVRRARAAPDDQVELLQAAQHLARILERIRGVAVRNDD